MPCSPVSSSGYALIEGIIARIHGLEKALVVAAALPRAPAFRSHRQSNRPDPHRLRLINDMDKATAVSNFSNAVIRIEGLRETIPASGIQNSDKQ
jgi:hypothetical protein